MERHTQGMRGASRQDKNTPTSFRFRGISLLTLLFIGALLVLLAGCSASGTSNNDTTGTETFTQTGAEASEPVTPKEFKGDVRDLPKAKDWQPGDPVIEHPRITHPRPPADAPQGRAVTLPGADLVARQAAAPLAGARVLSPPALNFDGSAFTGVSPPDTVGDVGPNHYIQMVNHPSGSLFRIYDKTGALLAGPSVLTTLWTAGGNCANGRGDPIVLYDGLADRWLMSEFSGTANRLCVYVSQTNDPVAGGWFLYEFVTPNFPDYPKYAVWPDAYYVSSNEASPAVYALDRTQMLAGLPATSQRFTAPNLAGFPFQALIPGDLDGATPPPAGSPGYFMRHRDDEVHNAPGDPTRDFLEVWEFRVDFANPANSTFTGPLNIAVAEFDSDLCGLSSFFCFPQPGTTVTLDPLREVIMWRLQYRNFGGNETLVGNLVTDVNGADHGGIRWFELRRNAPGNWSLQQEGTYAPDAEHRWMGSIAMDGSGNIALGYSVSSGSVFPSMRYTGRLAGDAPGVMTQPETTIIAGTGSQTTSTRWGDYSAMSVDPADDCTFWHTNEYMPAGGAWRTRIATFRFDECGNQPPVAVCQDVAVPADGSCQGTVLPGDVDNGSYDPDGDPITLVLSPPGPFPLGDTPVTLTVTDDHGASGSCSATVAVIDTIGVTLSANPEMLWPPNHKMVPVMVSVTASPCGGTVPACRITGVSSDEPINGIGDGNTEPDWEITGDLTVNLRAERAGDGDGRVYSLTVECTGGSGGDTTETLWLTVPHDQGP